MRYYLIPARGGPKRIADKNLADLGGQPLLAWTVATALESSRRRDEPVYVSSEDGKILDIAESLGAVPHKRPGHLADDRATMRDVLREFFKAHADAEDIVLLYPTVPFRQAATVDAALAMYDAGTMAGPHLSLMSVREHRGRPFGGVRIIDGKLAYSAEAAAYYRGQDTPALYFANGAIYVIAREVVDRLNTQLFCEETVPFVMHGVENLDIDEPYDMDVARALVAGGVVRAPATIKPLDLGYASAWAGRQSVEV